MAEDEDGISVVVEEVTGGGSIAQGEGFEVETGDRVLFAGDNRAMYAIAEAIEAGEEPTAFVPSWAILSRRAAKVEHTATFFEAGRTGDNARIATSLDLPEKVWKWTCSCGYSSDESRHGVAYAGRPKAETGHRAHVRLANEKARV
jgi:hypothetical protein